MTRARINDGVRFAAGLLVMCCLATGAFAEIVILGSNFRVAAYDGVTPAEEFESNVSSPFVSTHNAVTGDFVSRTSYDVTFKPSSIFMMVTFDEQQARDFAAWSFAHSAGGILFRPNTDLVVSAVADYSFSLPGDHTWAYLIVRVYRYEFPSGDVFPVWERKLSSEYSDVPQYGQFQFNDSFLLPAGHVYGMDYFAGLEVEGASSASQQLLNGSGELRWWAEKVPEASSAVLLLYGVQLVRRPRQHRRSPRRPPSAA